jgi:hypothetical protein
MDVDERSQKEKEEEALRKLFDVEERAKQKKQQGKSPEEIEATTKPQGRSPKPINPKPQIVEEVTSPQSCGR